MSVITFVCAGQMNSAITFPAFENGHEVRLVGSPLDRDIIDGLKKDNFHLHLLCYNIWLDVDHDLLHIFA